MPEPNLRQQRLAAAIVGGAPSIAAAAEVAGYSHRNAAYVALATNGGKLALTRARQRQDSVLARIRRKAEARVEAEIGEAPLREAAGTLKVVAEIQRDEGTTESAGNEHEERKRIASHATNAWMRGALLMQRDPERCMQLLARLPKLGYACEMPEGTGGTPACAGQTQTRLSEKISAASEASELP